MQEITQVVLGLLEVRIFVTLLLILSIIIRYGGRMKILITNTIYPLTGNNAFKSPEDFKVSLALRTNYLYGRIKKSLPEMYAFTVCMWLKSNASPGIGTPFSYGVPGQANEIVLIEWGNNPIELLVNDKVCLMSVFIIN